MELTHALIDARRWLASCSAEDIDHLRSVCLDIHEAEKRLMQASAFYLQRCIHHCEGLCCRNVFLGEVMGFEDFCFLLVLRPDCFEALFSQASHLKTMFTADCPFLLNGVGPCSLPEAVRPEVCITSFCMQTPDADAAIGAVQARFRKLSRIIRWIRCKQLFRKMVSSFSA
ncbi:MAG: hypothetical protein AB1547_10655 [Thermodesulfobacteriota bacterium]